MGTRRRTKKKKPTKTLNTEKLKDDQHRPYLSRIDNSERQTTMGTRHRTKTKKNQPKHSTQKS